MTSRAGVARASAASSHADGSTPDSGPSVTAAELDAMSINDLIPEAPPLSLRERKKAAAIRRIQQVAIEQFEEHGFDQVTIDHIAEHAEVSPSSIYRYFGTKEALVLRDEYDEQILAVAPFLLARYDVYTAFEVAIGAVAQAHLLPDADLAWRRTKVWMQTPSIRAAGYLQAQQMAEDLTPMVVAAPTNEFTAEQAYVVCFTAVMAIYAGIENWYRGGGTADMMRIAADAIALVKPAWAHGPQQSDAH